MAITMDMLSVIDLKTPPGSIPSGMKVTAIQGPDTLASAPLCPALAVGGFTIFPFSYYDNRVSFGMVSYDLKGNLIKQEEKAGARYVYKITLDGSGTSGSVSVWGQANQKVTLTLDEILNLMIEP